jgi:hypothetical protein
MIEKWVTHMPSPKLPQLALKHGFHTKEVKKLAYFITRNAGSKSKGEKRKVRGLG